MAVSALSPKQYRWSVLKRVHAGRAECADQQDGRNDARGIAQMMRVGLYRSVHVKTLRSQKLRMLLTHRKLLQSKAIAIENDLRGTLRNFGLKVGMVGTLKFEARIFPASAVPPPAMDLPGTPWLSRPERLVGGPRARLEECRGNPRDGLGLVGRLR
jgi:transposase